ncbi:MAG: phosphatase PAP2 family protein [Acidobacteriota bacterium]
MRSPGQWLRESSVIRVGGGFALAALVLWASGWFVTGPYRGSPAAFDASIRFTMRQIQSPMWTQLFLAVTRLGSTLVLTIIGCVAGIIFISLRWFRPLLVLIVVMFGQAALHHGFKLLFARPRPPSLINYPAVESFSFPSGHAVASLCLYGTIAWIVASCLENSAAKAGIAIFAAVLIVLIGMSRIYIGIHYPTDVLAGFLAAAIWTVAAMSIDRKAL